MADPATAANRSQQMIEQRNHGVEWTEMLQKQTDGFIGNRTCLENDTKDSGYGCDFSSNFATRSTTKIDLSMSVSPGFLSRGLGRLV